MTDQQKVREALDYLHTMVTSSHNAGWKKNREMWEVVRQAALDHASSATTNPQESSSKLVDARDAKYSRDLRNLIYADVQFDMRGETDLTFPDMARLVDRGWMAEGDENYEFEITDEGREAIDQAIAGGRGDGHG